MARPKFFPDIGCPAAWASVAGVCGLRDKCCSTWLCSRHCNEAGCKARGLPLVTAAYGHVSPALLASSLRARCAASIPRRYLTSSPFTIACYLVVSFTCETAVLPGRYPRIVSHLPALGASKCLKSTFSKGVRAPMLAHELNLSLRLGVGSVLVCLLICKGGTASATP